MINIKILKELNLRRLKCSNEGVVGIVVAVLLIGLLVSVVSLIQYQYVPKWMEEKEAEHMNDVLNQFSQLKFAIDSQSASGQTNTPIATPGWMSKTFSSLDPSGARSLFLVLPCRSRM